MKKVYVGTDVGSKECAAAAIDSRGKMVDCEAFRTSGSNLISFVERQKGRVAVLIEEGEMAGWVVRTLAPAC